MPVKTDLHNSEANSERDSISHHSLSPITHRTSTGLFGSTLPALQDPRYVSIICGYNTSSYDHTPSPASTTSLYSHYSYPQSGYSTTASSYSPTVPSIVTPYTMTPDSARPRIPSMHSPASHHASSPVSSTLSSVRSAYATSTPHTSRHHRSPKDGHTPHSPLPNARVVRSPTTAAPSTMSAQLEAASSASTQTGPPMGNTQILCNLFSADGVLVEPEIHGRVEKGFFLADRDWTCYRRNYFTVVCSYSLKPATHSLPFYIKRTNTSPPENVLAFAMCISAVVDAPGGKTVELVQHTPKRDKGPQHKPSKIKLAPQPAGGMSFNTTHGQQAHNSQGSDFSPFPQQTQQQNVASFERIQFKSATANNGKRRAAQQYYHLIVELYADVGTSNSSTPSSTSSDAGWVKIAYKTSAPMVVRGRSPGHYADERRIQSPGGGNGSGNGNNTQSPTSNGNGGMMSSSDFGTSSDVLGASRLNMANMNGYHNVGTISHSAHASPSPSSIRDPSIATPPPVSQLDGPPIDPVITGDDNTPLETDYTGYQYFPSTIYSGHHNTPVYEDVYSDERKSEGPVIAHCVHFENDISSYIPSTMVGKDQRLGYRKCGPYGDSTDGSRGYFPDLPTV
ncbi:hypothetical protein BDZ91DRAFT_670313 [Kalaharituber pfeilii]|nr:hypothetical protein BDZ91DRAFT_670313 [Kalaharituber pfeilii]